MGFNKGEITMETKYTQRGFGVVTFKEDHGEDCSIQISSAIREESFIWIGMDKPSTANVTSKDNPLQSVHVNIPEPIHVYARMHLSQSMVGELLPILEHFHKTGKLPE